MFLFWAQHGCRKFLLKSFWSCALAWYCQKHHLTTHTSYFLNTSLTNNFSLHTTPLHTWPFWKTSSSSEAICEIELLDAWPLDVRPSGCMCDTPASLFSWSQTCSNIRFGDRNRALLCTLIAYCLLRNDYSHGWNKWYCSAMPDHFSCFMARLFTEQSLYFYTSTFHIYNLSGICFLISL
jgi:hypothetical protein